MHSILSSVIEESLSYQTLQPGEVVLDIGGNDGTLLSLIKRPECKMINIDAASNIKQEYQISNYTYVNSKFDSEAYLTLDIPAPKLIFSVAVFYQLSNPLQFLRDVGKIMNGESLFVLQMTYLESMYTNNIFDNVVHEHVTYFSLQSFIFIAELAGLKVLGARVVDSYGGSLRVFLVKNTSLKILPNLMNETKEIMEVESQKKINSRQTLLKFGNDFEVWKSTLGELLDFQFKKYGPIIGMGASTKGNMILQSLNITEKIMPFIMDNNPKKIGSRTTGSFIPIVDEDEVIDLETNIMSLPYYYDDFFKKILSPKIGLGKFIDFISPLPKPNVTRILGE
jgi:NDP-4-keto-2,6-dideoxyhexose 3-C-methyltransferase